MMNTLAKFKKYTDKLDEVYQSAALTAVLDGDSELVQMGANAGEMVIPKISMDGLADYSRSGGYVDGDVTLNYETVNFNYDRGRVFTVDAMDNEETAGVAFGRLAGEFVRTKAAPEMDAFRFAAYASHEGIGKKEGELTDGDSALAALIEAQNAMDDAEVPVDQRYLFISSQLYNLILNVDTTKSKAVLDSFQQVVKVPKSRFYTQVKLNDGASEGETVGGFAAGEEAKAINFMVIHKGALLQYPKHTVNKIIAPQENQTSDGWKFFYSAYGLADVYENKLAGIYLHCQA
ncbi:MAG: hypothetical protein IKK98_01335 [Oscillospiraceae bacterium]|nr:hypothetical protein [Oscillospiraceae bacterium]